MATFFGGATLQNNASNSRSTLRICYVDRPPSSGNAFFFCFYCYENNSLLYFYCNWLESLVQVSYEAVSYKNADNTI